MTETAGLSRRESDSALRLDHAPAVADIFDGPGPSRAALRAVDWSTTPLGPVEHWPLDLLCAARTILLAPTPMLLWWGAQFIQFHNDAVIAAFGGDDPAVGRPAVDCWPARWEVWSAGPTSVLATGRQVHLDDVALPIDEQSTSYWTLSMGPLRDHDASVAGVLCAAVDRTFYEVQRQSADAATANLQIALETNRRIGTAIGILMAHRRITDTAAFDLLRVASQRGHRKLRDIADDVVLTGALPD